MKKSKIETFKDLVPPSCVCGSNPHRVSKKEWAKWGQLARGVFNGLYEEMTEFQNLFVHPEAFEIDESEWKPIAWNAAFIAACTAEKLDREIRGKRVTK